MTGAADHVRIAERLLADAADQWAAGDRETHDAEVAAAHVHALLAQAVAALPATDYRPVVEEPVVGRRRAS